MTISDINIQHARCNTLELKTSTHENKFNIKFINTEEENKLSRYNTNTFSDKNKKNLLNLQIMTICD